MSRITDVPAADSPEKDFGESVRVMEREGRDLRDLCADPVHSVLLSHLRVLELENRELRRAAERGHGAECTACCTLLEENNDLRELLAQQEKTIAELQERANRNSSNSSMPPSSNPPDAKRYPKKKRLSWKKRGGQPGHPGVTFQPYTAVEADITVRDHEPDVCSHCGHDGFAEEIGDALPHQVVEPPKLRPQVTEHRLHSRCCAKCHGVTRAKLPSNVSPSNFGPQTSAVVCMLTGFYPLSDRHVADIMQDLFGIRMSVGVIPTIQNRMTSALKKPVSEAKESVKQAAAVHNDATGWKRNGKKEYAFVTVTDEVITYDITPQHNSEVILRLLGPDFKGILTSDRHTIYNVIPVEQRQICNSHTDRDFRKMEERGGESKSTGERGTELEHKLFHEWHRFERGEISREQLQGECTSIEDALKKVLTEGCTCCQHPDTNRKKNPENKVVACIHKKTQRTCKNLLDLLPAFFTFATHENVKPTNNFAEQAGRLLVIMRKLSFGSKSEAGDRYVESMLTTAATLRKQGRHLLSFLVAAFTALVTGAEPPCLMTPSAVDSSRPAPDSNGVGLGAGPSVTRPPPWSHSAKRKPETPKIKSVAA